ncbi:MAG: fibronectin type III domain-containing protein [Firmicutes bacterium]|nr:fibronectin type III domain-containing protein [Bacillota bacterium]
MVLAIISSFFTYSYAANTKPAKKNKGNFEIQYYLGPDAMQIASDDKLAKRIADAGFTVIALQPSYKDVNEMVGLWAYADAEGAAALKKALKRLDDNDIKVYLKLGTISGDLVEGGVWNDHSQKLAKKYLDGRYDNVIGVDLGDEPRIYSAQQYAAAMVQLHKTFPNVESYFNLFPIYAADAVLGIGDSYTTYTRAYYEKYLRAFFNQKNVNHGLFVFSADYYPRLRGWSGPHETDVSYYENLDYLLTISKENKGSIPMNLVGLSDGLIDPTREDHIMYQVNTNLAFGMKRISYFTGIDPCVDPVYDAIKTEAHAQGIAYGWNAGWVFEKDGTPSKIYGVIKKVNAKVKPLGNLLYPKEVLSVDRICKKKKSNRSYYGKREYLKKVGDVSIKKSSAASSGLVTAFSDGTIMLTNGSADTPVSFTVTKYALKDMDYFNTKSGTWKSIGKIMNAQKQKSKAIQLEDGKLFPADNTVRLDGGTAIVLRVKSGAKPLKKIGKTYLSVSSYTYNGKKQKEPVIYVKDSKGKKIAKSNYTVTKPKTQLKAIGKYTYTIRFKGDYIGIKKLTLTIKPAKPTIKAPRAAKNTVIVKWNKGKKGQVTGYQVMAATNSKFTKNTKALTIKGYGKTSAKMAKLKAKTKYYVKVRTYKTVKGVKIYSNWSEVKTIQTK